MNALNLPLLFRLMVSGFIETSASITAGVAVGEAVAVGEGVVTGVGVAAVVDSEIMPPGTRIVSLVFVEALNICAAAVDVPRSTGWCNGWCW